MIACLPSFFATCSSNPASYYVRLNRNHVVFDDAVSCKQAPKNAENLTGIPGVGRRNAQLLVNAGYQDLSAVQHWFCTECSQDVETFVQQLQVGITCT